MKKLLSIISVLAVLGVFTLSNTNVQQEQSNQVAVEKTAEVQRMMVDPGGGGW
ncbi:MULTISPECIES: complement C1q protein [Bacillus]|uniref:complement C1q protein n=1 Tax=Bacillus TaxID=1386 RepID=UPI000BF5064B|nr:MULTISPECIES: complement C1q protein [Bacillus cereus group]MED4447392.1 complement C1q protein [Bacillus cereus]PEV02183.1 complement C1q protein [Bacillus thuringiensis]PFC97100.1 complement C1q protein [Bacillus cereus]PFL05119.1 complement C1q protein [Bacillus thuringiensis]PGP53307.1 complement C1q protein [Bacillus thuringiensis]